MSRIWPLRTIVAGQKSALASGVEDVEVRRVLRDVAALAASDLVPPPVVGAEGHEHVGPAVARNADRGVVLLRSADVVGHVVRGVDVVELGRAVVLLRPGGASVQRDVASAVVGAAHPLSVIGIDPEIVVVAVGRLDLGVESNAAVGRLVEVDVQRVDRLAVLRIRVEAGIVEGALAELSLIVRSFPGGAAVVGAEDASLGRLHDRPDPLRICRGDSDSDLSDRTLGHSRVFRQLDPGVAAVF